MRRVAAALAALIVLLPGCTTDADPPLPDEEPSAQGPAIVVSLPLLGNVAEQIVDGHGQVTVLHPSGTTATLSTAQRNQVANAALVLVHGIDAEAEILAAAQPTADGPTPPRVEAVNEWLDPGAVTAATWFDPIHMARIALRLGEVLAEVDREGVRTADDWHEAAEEVATAIAATFDEATDRLDNVAAECRRARGHAELLASLGARFGIREAAEGDTTAADLTGVTATLVDAETWQDWFGAIIDRVASADTDCTPPPEPSPRATTTVSPTGSQADAGPAAP